MLLLKEDVVCVCPLVLIIAYLIDHFLLVLKINLYAVTLWKGLQCVHMENITNTSNSRVFFILFFMSSEQLPPVPEERALIVRPITLLDRSLKHQIDNHAVK